ncbi:hypothetical protein PCL_10090 [Purpureocillium lilacinum]|uniref:Uncharacterized protein n=1 Tax=Purpureocillium lilacinum TaxID=33203 RepID=A0A2U3EEY4_PURLI|nr:hypothetical protein PCL_10090 [Purpureocillium lilacinum]
MPGPVTWGTKHWLHGMALLHTSVLRDHGDGDMPVASSRDCAMLTPCSTTFVLISKRDLSPAWGAGSAMARKHGESRASETQKQLREEQTSYSRLPKRAKTKTDLECYESHVASPDPVAGDGVSVKTDDRLEPTCEDTYLTSGKGQRRKSVFWKIPGNLASSAHGARRVLERSHGAAFVSSVYQEELQTAMRTRKNRSQAPARHESISRWRRADGWADGGPPRSVLPSVAGGQPAWRGGTGRGGRLCFDLAGCRRREALDAGRAGTWAEMPGTDVLRGDACPGCAEVASAALKIHKTAPCSRSHLLNGATCRVTSFTGGLIKDRVFLFAKVQMASWLNASPSNDENSSNDSKSDKDRNNALGWGTLKMLE